MQMYWQSLVVGQTVVGTFLICCPTLQSAHYNDAPSFPYDQITTCGLWVVQRTTLGTTLSSHPPADCSRIGLAEFWAPGLLSLLYEANGGVIFLRPGVSFIICAPRCQQNSRVLGAICTSLGKWCLATKHDVCHSCSPTTQGVPPSSATSACSVGWSGCCRLFFLSKDMGNGCSF